MRSTYTVSVSSSAILLILYCSPLGSTAIFWKYGRFSPLYQGTTLQTGGAAGAALPACFPNDLLRAIGPAFDALFVAGTHYHATGVILHHFSEAYYGQLDLFGEVVRMQRLSHLYESVDALSAKYGKHTLVLAASLPAHLHAQHAGNRGELPERLVTLLPGETSRKRLGIPLFLGEVR
jgi:hypothetical protein